MKLSPHNHVESFLTASTLANMLKRAKGLNREYFCYTDLGHLSSALKTYSMCKKEKLKPILGLEIFFKDPACQIVAGTPADRCSYFNCTIYAKDQAAYQRLVQIVSRTDLATIEIYEEKQSLWTWAELEDIAKYNVELVVGGSVHDIVGKAYLADTPQLAAQVFLKLKTLFQDKISVALLCEKWDRKFSQVVEINFTDGTKDSILATDYVTTDKARNIKALDLITKKHHTRIKSKNVSNTYYDVSKNIQSVKLHKGYLPLEFDVSLQINKILYAFAKNFKVPVLATDYAFYCERTDKIVQELVLESKTRLSPTLNMKSEEEFCNYLIQVMGLSEKDAKDVLANNDSWASKFDNFELKYEWRLADSGGDPLKQCMEIIKKNGRMKWDDPVYIARLKEEIEVIAFNPRKNLSGYFLPIVEVLDFYKKNNYLTSIGRGSAGSSLFCYLLGITHIDPIKWNLPFSRFFSLDRIMRGSIPDIDVDLPTKKPLIGEDGKSGFLFERWGDKASLVSTRSNIRLKSAIKDTNRHLKGVIQREIEVLTKGLPSAPQNTSDADFVFGYEDPEEGHIEGLLDKSESLQKYVQERPDEWEIVQKALGVTRAFSIHACATLLSDIPIKDVVPIKDGHISQYEYKQAEEAGLIKYDFLTVNQLLDIQECVKLINKKNGDPESPTHFRHNGEMVFIWDLPQNQEVFESIWDGLTKTLFQISTSGMSNYTKQLKPNKMEDLMSTLALQRPGPLDFFDESTGRNMTEEYLFRRKGLSKCDIPELEQLLPDTYGIICYQEDLNKIARTIAEMDGSTAEKLRENMAKKKMSELVKMKPDFIKGAVKNVSQETAETLWNQMVTFGRYGFSIIHSAEYGHITYATMFLKHFYLLEWLTSVLTNADQKEITGSLWSTIKDYFTSPDINLSSDRMEIDYANEKIRAKLGVIRGLGDKTAEPIVANRPYKDIKDFIQKDVAAASLTRKLIHTGVLDSLFPPRMSFLEKLKMFEDELEIHKFLTKKKEYEAEGKVLKQTQPKEGKLPEEYLNMSPLEDACKKKATLPSMVVGLYDLGARYSKALNEKSSMIMVNNSKGIPTMLIPSETLQRIAESDGMTLEKDLYIAATGYINEISEFSYQNNTKKALKLNLDFDGINLGEMVQWPDYKTGELKYDTEAVKGSIITVFFRKKAGHKDMNIQEFVLEASPKKKSLKNS